MKEEIVYQKNALVLAYIGDAVFTQYVREHLIERFDFKVSSLNSKANGIVRAKNQALLIDKFFESLNEKEQEIAKRGRNAHFNSKAKNSTVEEYAKATSFEAVVGYMYLSKSERLNEFLEKCFEESVR